MTTITPEAAQKACDLANAHRIGNDYQYFPYHVIPEHFILYALALHIMEFDAFKRKVSDVIELYERQLNGGAGDFSALRRFIIPAPDPLLIEARKICAAEAGENKAYQYLDGSRDDYPDMRIALAALRRGLEVRPVGEVGK